MSFDLGVWYAQKRIGSEEARELYGRLCDGDSRGVIPHPAIDEFYAELTVQHPEIDTIPQEKTSDLDYCPWSCKLDHSPGHVIMACVWSKATDVHRFVKILARKHGLALYDPQSEVVTYPDGSTGPVARASRGGLLTLGFCALLFAAIFVYSAPSGSSLVFYSFAGLCGLMAVACFRQARLTREGLKVGSTSMFGLFKSKPFLDEQLGQFRRSDGHWKGNLEIAACGTFRLSLGGSREAPDPLALRLAKELPKRFNLLKPKIQASLFEHYAPYEEAVAAGELTGSPCLNIANPEAVWPYVTAAHVLIEPSATVEIAFRVAWDAEHTVAAIFRDWQFIELNGSV